MIDAPFWHMTHEVRSRSGRSFKLTAHGVPGPRIAANTHLRKIYIKLYPSSTVRLLNATPDRIAEAREMAR